MAPTTAHHGVLGIGSNALRAMRATLMQDLGDDAGATRLQEMGYAAGEEVYTSFLEWLPSYTGVTDPGDLDAATLTDVMSAFLEGLGWGSVEVERSGKKGLTIYSSDWAEAEPQANLEGPSCFFSTGMLASFLTAFAGHNPVAVMEVECRSEGDTACRFLAGAPDTLGAVYDAVSEGQDYTTVLE
jgi:predicted hydrocarbon binding protein